LNENGEKVELATIYLEATQRHFGGHRLLVSVPTLRPPLSCWDLADSRCHRSRYASQKETREDRATRAMMKIVRRLSPDDLNVLGSRARLISREF